MQNDNQSPGKKDDSTQSNSADDKIDDQPDSSEPQKTPDAEQDPAPKPGHNAAVNISDSDSDSDSVVNLSDAALIKTPLDAILAIILKPNRVFARIKNTGNWSWVPFLFLIIMASLPALLYFNTVEMDWYVTTMVDLQYGDISPAEKNQYMQFMSQQQQNLAAITATLIIFWLAIINAVFAFYLYKITQADPENVMSFGDWYGFTWWASLPLAFVSIITSLIILVVGHPQLMPDYLAPLSLAFVLDIPLNSAWYSLFQSISLEVFWAIYLTAVGVSQWTNLPTKQCYMIAIAPAVIIWGVRTLFTLL